MKKVVIFLFLAAALCLQAQDIVVSRDSKPSQISIVEDRMVDRAAPSLNLECHVAKLTATVVDTPKGKFAQLTIPAFQATNVAGAPQLPRMNRLIEVPMGAELQVRVLSHETQEYSLRDAGIMYPIMPCQPSHPKDGSVVPFAYDSSAYAQKGYSRTDLVKVVDLGMLRNFRLALLEVAPVAYDPATERIEVYNNIQIELSLVGANLTETARIQNLHFSPYFNWIQGRILSSASLQNLRRGLPPFAMTYVIVADRMFQNDLAPFIAWKTQKGFQVTVGYTDEIGKTTADIQKYIHGLYNNATEENRAPSFVLFVGDYEQVTSFKGKTGSHISDLYYATVTADYLPDIYTGRFSARNSAELLPQIEKTLQYEKYEMPDPSFLKNAVMVAGWDSSHAVEWGWPQIKYGVQYFFNEAHGIPNVSVFLSAGSQQNATQIRNLVSAGTAYLNYTAHGSSTSWADPSFSQANIDSLMNQGRYPLVVGNCCLTNKFEVATCFGESWLRVKDKGAIGYIGGSNSTYWDEDLWWGNGNYPIVHPNSTGAAPDQSVTGKGAYEYMFTSSIFSNDAMIVAGNLAVEESNSPRKLYYWEVYHIMGDPALMIYLGIPSVMEVTHPETISLSAASLEVTAPSDALISLSMNGQNLGTSMADAQGKSSFSVKLRKTGEALLVVTKKNCQPYFATIKVVE